MEYGKIISVNYVNGSFLCDVQPIRPTDAYENVPILRDYSGFYRKPREGQRVAIERMTDGTRVIIGFLARHESDQTPERGELAPEDFRIQVDDETFIELSRRENDLRKFAYDLNIRASGDINIEVPPDQDPKRDEDSTVTVRTKGESSSVNVVNEGKNGTVRLQTTGENALMELLSENGGDITIDSEQGDVDIAAENGNVVIDGIDFDKHVHQYDDSTVSDTKDGSGNKSTSQKQTEPPQDS